MIDNRIEVGRIAVMVSTFADKSFGHYGKIKLFNGLRVDIECGEGVVTTYPSGVALVCDTREEVEKVLNCDNQTYDKIRELKKARQAFIRNLQQEGSVSLK